jgi:AraC-like DNA-binding protein
MRTVRLTGATFFSAEFRAPWGFTSPPIETVASSLQDRDAHLVLFHLVLEGRATARVEGAPDITLQAGDIVAFPQGHAHRVWRGRPRRWYDTAPAVQRALAGELQVTRTEGTGDATRFVCGYFSCDRWASEVVLAGLPSVLTVNVRDGDRRGWLEDAIQFLAAEAASDHAGRSALLTKLSEALFVESLRRWMTALPREHTGWLAGARDNVVGRALALLHRQPSRDWTLNTLAREAGASRSKLAERFAHYLHEPPMTYLARWRLRQGARLLATTHQSVIEVAASVGYESETAFNRAFRREYGLPPGRYRRAASS